MILQHIAVAGHCVLSYRSGEGGGELRSREIDGRIISELLSTMRHAVTQVTLYLWAVRGIDADAHGQRPHDGTS